MKLTITHQEKYSRGQLILRTLFGWLYIGIPHLFLMFFVGIWSAILAFATFWVVLFTQRFPKGIFDWQIKYMNWGARVNAVLSNLVDGYPAFFPKGESDTVPRVVIGGLADARTKQHHYTVAGSAPSVR